MSNFFDNYFNFKKIAENKREYKRQMARVEALPDDYRFVFTEIQKHTWRFAGGDGMDMLRIHYDLIDLFESSAAEGMRVIDITGENVADFCDELLKNTRTYAEDWRTKLNDSVLKKLGGTEDE